VSTLEDLDRWRAGGSITAGQHQALSRLVQRDRVSLYLELNVLLYLGVLSIAGGLTWTARVYAGRWGDFAVLVPLTLLVAGCAGYCWWRAPAFSRERVEPPGIAFDYVLYLACLAAAVEVGYVEYRFHLLQEKWDYYLLVSAITYLLLAYRFDNRFVLSLGIAALGSWFGVRLSYLPDIDVGAVRLAALGYGFTVAALGLALDRVGIKRHFLDAYLHIATNVVLATELSGAAASSRPSFWTVALVATAAAVVWSGVRFRRFAFVVYGVIYAYAGISREVLRTTSDPTSALSYLVISAGAVLLGLVILSRQLGHDE
jgi:hypothetical protein